MKEKFKRIIACFTMILALSISCLPISALEDIDNFSFLDEVISLQEYVTVKDIENNDITDLFFNNIVPLYQEGNHEELKEKYYKELKISSIIVQAPVETRSWATLTTVYVSIGSINYDAVMKCVVGEARSTATGNKLAYLESCTNASGVKAVCAYNKCSCKYISNGKEVSVNIFATYARDMLSGGNFFNSKI